MVCNCRPPYDLFVKQSINTVALMALMIQRRAFDEDDLERAIQFVTPYVDEAWAEIIHEREYPERYDDKETE